MLRLRPNVKGQTRVKRLRLNFLPLPMFNAPGEGGGTPAGDGNTPPPGDGTPPAGTPPAGDPPQPASVLYPNDAPPAGDGNPPAGGNQDDGNIDPADLAGWKEYEPDPNKSDEENARLKEEHDQTKPTGDGEPVVPDNYDDLVMPEGVELDKELLGALTPAFKDLFLTKEQAQLLTDKFIEHQRSAAAKTAQGWAETVAGWADTARADPEIGGAKWDATVAASIRAVEKLGSPELKSYLQASGGGNHPELIRIFAKVGAMIREDDPIGGGAEGAGKPANAAHLLYPNDAPKG